MVGQSGVGKSSLINQLGSDELAKVGNLSKNKYKGTHTTTTSRLYHLENFDLIDSPGIREFGLTKVTKQEVLNGFPEIQSLALIANSGTVVTAMNHPAPFVKV